MVPDIAKTGHSFKGAMAYYLHDKRQEGQGQHPPTAERVAWTETRNLAADGPHTATRIMIATAQRADELKREAGIKATGRKSNAHVYAYSLAWHPDEAGALGRAEMVRAVDASLKALGAEQHQAVIICHRDQKHPHVHVVVNRVHPETGRMLSTSNDRLKLSDWANAYERERGHIVTPRREEKRQAREQFKQAAAPPAAGPQRPPVIERDKTRPKSKTALLKNLTDAQKAQHRQDWKDLAERDKAERERIYKGYGRAIANMAAQHKTETKPAWAQFFRAARMDERAFHARERSIVGVLQNALAATPLGQRGSLSALFGNVLSAQSREAAFKAAQEAERAKFADQVRAVLNGHMKALKNERAAALAAQRVAYTKERAGLIERQNAEKAKTREAWKQVYERRGKDPRHQFRQEQKAMKRDFDKARRVEQAPVPTVPHEKQRLSTAAPQLTPQGVPEPRPTQVQNVPRVDKAAEWAKSGQGKEAVPQNAPAPSLRDKWQQSSNSQPAPAEQEKQSLRERWGAKAAEAQKAEREGPSHDFERDR